MQVGTLRLRLNKLGSDVPIVDATPAEAMLLHILHQQNNGGSTYGEEMDKITVTGEAMVETGEEVPDQVEPGKPAVGEVGKPGYQPAVPGKVLTTKKGLRPRTDSEELRRLSAKYGANVDKKGNKIISLVWPDKVNVKLPQKFSDINWKEVNFDGGELGALNYATGQLATK